MILSFNDIICATMKRPFVTITIPTFNSVKTLKICLESLRKQTYKNIEINIIDGDSKDSTVQTAKKFGVDKIEIVPGSLLLARYQGVKIAKGKYTLIFDSDQVLEKTAIERAVNKMEKDKLDMLVLEEDVYKTDTFIEKLFQMDRKLINTVSDLSPFTGVAMPRMFNTKLLKAAYAKIPKSMFKSTGGPDHAIVYYECSLLSDKISVLPHAVKHMEPSTFLQLWKKFYRWGHTSVIDVNFGKYREVMTRKEKLRTGIFTNGLFIESFGSIILVGMKYIPFKVGYFMAKYG